MGFKQNTQNRFNRRDKTANFSSMLDIAHTQVMVT